MKSHWRSKQGDIKLYRKRFTIKPRSIIYALMMIFLYYTHNPFILATIIPVDSITTTLSFGVCPGNQDWDIRIDIIFVAYR